MIKAIKRFWSVSDANFADKVADTLEHNAWSRYAKARNRYGREVKVTDPTAVSFCAVGAIEVTADIYKLRFNKQRLQQWIEGFTHYIGRGGGLEDIKDPVLVMDTNKLTIGRWNDGADQSVDNVVSHFRGYADHLRGQDLK